MPISPSPTATSHKYSVPIVLTDVAPAEGLLSAFDALSHLASITTDVFSRISNRITDQKSQLSSLLSRIQAAQQRVDQISKNSARVTTIYSTSKYPAPKVLPDVPRLVANDSLMLNGDAFENAHRKALPHKLKAGLRNVTAPPTDSSELFKFFTMHRVTHGEHEAAEEKESSGLGRLPSYLPSVSSILLFNTEENPYKTYNSLNNLEGVGGEDRKQQSAGPSEAPKSILEGADLPAFAGFQFDYKPLLGELPTLSLPANLPLSRLADISFGTEQPAPSIAPSIAPALPSLDMLALPSVSMAHRREAKSTVPQYLALGPGTSSSSSSAPSAAASSSIPAPPAAPDAPPAPPMAPAPPSAPSRAPSAPSAPAAPQSTSDEGADDSAGGDDDGGGDGARSALLSAIRDAKNMSRLKKVGDRLKEQEKAREKKLLASAAGESSSSGGGGGGGEEAGGDGGGGGGGDDESGGDLMAALRARLARRRNVIGGKNQDDKVAAPGSNAQAAPPPEWARKSTLRSAPRKGGADEKGNEVMDAQEKASKSDVVKQAMAAHQAAKKKDDEDWEQLE